MPCTSNSASDDRDPVSIAEGASADHTYYLPAHSDYLIHWTGIDIDPKHDPDWYKQHSSTTDSNVTCLYLQRLKDILRHGLWMMDDNETVTMDNNNYSRPQHYRTCFTELKLSMARGHARWYGRLGIGFKRFFLFNRLGGPMTYYHSSRKNWFTPSLWTSVPTAYQEYWSCFLKPMTEIAGDTTMQYSIYDESEWRIVYSNDIAKRLAERGQSDIQKLFVREEDFSSELAKLVSSTDRQPGAVIPIRDPWFAMIIYPSLATKTAAEADPEIRELINSIKPSTELPSTFAKRNPAWLERNCRPIELDLDACRHF